MSRHKKPQIDTTIPPKPEVLQAYEEQQRQHRLDSFFGRCTFYARGPCLPHPAIQGSMIAAFMFDQMMQAAIVAQSQIVIPR